MFYCQNTDLLEDTIFCTSSSVINVKLSKLIEAQ